MRCLYDTVQKHLKAMEYEPSGPFVTSILELKLDTKLIQCLNGRSRVKVQPQLVLYLNELLEFINLRAQASEGSTSDQGKRFPEGKSHHPRRSLVAGKPVPSFATNTIDLVGNRVLCKTDKYDCPKFKGQPHDKRMTTFKVNDLCINCLRPGYYVKQCKSFNQCRKCQK